MATALQVMMYKQIILGLIGLVLLEENHQHQYSALGKMHAMWLAVLIFFPPIMIGYAILCKCFTKPITTPSKFKGFTGGYALVIGSTITSVLLVGVNWPY